MADKLALVHEFSEIEGPIVAMIEFKGKLYIATPRQVYVKVDEPGFATRLQPLKFAPRDAAGY